jgi:hypothetical protein
MNKKTVKSLRLNRDTLRALTDTTLREAAGGQLTGGGCTDRCTVTCYPCTRYC